MFYLLFILYLILFCWLISRIQFFTKSGISTKILILLFLIRIVVSLMAGYLTVYYFPVSDSIEFHKGGIEQYNLLFQHPYEYLINIFEDTRQNNYSGFLDTSNSYWNDIKTIFMYKLLSVFDVFSGKNFFINTLFFNFLIFFGPVALYRVFVRIFPASFYKVIICVFLLPSALFYSSIIHRDGIILLALSFIIYHFYFMMEQRYFSIKRILMVIFFMGILLILRSYVFITLLPALLAWVIGQYNRKKAFISFLGVYVISAVLFFCSGYISAKTDLPRFVSERQQAFITLAATGASAIDSHPLHPGFRSFLHNAPEAFTHVLLRPYITEVKSFLYLPFALENILLILVFLLFVFFRKKKITIHPLAWFCFFFTFSIFLVTGYTVPILGAIVRYRSVYLIFLLLPLICYTDLAIPARILRIKYKKML